MRITNNMMFNSLSAGMNKAGERLLKVHQMLSTGKQFTKLSDDPVSMTIISGFKDVLNGLEQFHRNAGFAEDYLSNVDTAVFSINDALARLKEIAITSASETISVQTRANNAFEVDQIFKSLLSTGNTKVGNTYLFSGFKTDTPTFDSTGVYQGDINESSVFIGKGTTFKYGITGDRLFKGVGVTGGIDIYTTINNFKTALQTNDLTTIGATINLMDTAMTQVSSVGADIGGRINTLKSNTLHIEGFMLQTKELISNMEDADIAKISTELVKNQTNLEALQLTSAKFTGLSIFNFLR